MLPSLGVKVRLRVWGLRFVVEGLGFGVHSFWVRAYD